MYNFSSLQLNRETFVSQMFWKFGVETKIWGSFYLGGLTVGELFKNKAGFVKLSLSLQTFLDLKTNLYFLFITLLKIVRHIFNIETHAVFKFRWWESSIYYSEKNVTSSSNRIIHFRFSCQFCFQEVEI